MSDVPSSAPSSAPASSSPATPSKAPSTPSGPSGGSPKSNAAPSKGANAAAKTQSPVAQARAASNADKAPQQQTQAEKVEEARRKYKFKVDGKEWEEELGDDEIRARLQKGLAADKRMQEAAQLRKTFQDAMAYGKDNFDEVAKSMFGIDVDQYLEDRLEKRFQEAMMSEEQKEQANLKKELERYKKLETEQKAAAEQAARQKYEQGIWDQTEQTFIGALDKLGYEPATAKVLLPMMADLADAALDSGVDLDADMLAYETNKRLKALNGHRLKSLKGDRLLAELGDDVVREVLRAKVAAAKLAPVEPEAPPEEGERVAPPDGPVRHGRSGRGPPKFKRKHLFGL